MTGMNKMNFFLEPSSFQCEAGYPTGKKTARDLKRAAMPANITCKMCL